MPTAHPADFWAEYLLAWGASPSFAGGGTWAYEMLRQICAQLNESWLTALPSSLAEAKMLVYIR